MPTVITFAGERLFAQKAQANQQLDIDTFIFANVPGQDASAPIDRNEGLPPVAQRVHQQAVQQYGRINDNVVIYSTVLDSVTGPFEFNWVGLYSSVNQTLVAIQHVPTVVKTITAPGVAGNTLNRNFGIEYSGIAELTGITVAPETWQLDFTARLSGMDELTRQLAADMNGRDWFIGDGFKVVPRATLNTFSVTPGVGYVSGLRIELENEAILTAQSYPLNVYVDAWFDGTNQSTWKPQTSFTVTGTEMDDYIDVQGRPHYVFKLAVLESANDVKDLRTTQGLASQLAVLQRYAAAESQVQRVVQGLQAGRDVNIVVMSDSTGDAVNEWVYLTATALGQDYPHYKVIYKAWNDANKTYDPDVQIQAGTSSAVLRVWNAAIPGSKASRFVGDLLPSVLKPQQLIPDLVMISYGHNGGNVPERQYSMHANLVAEVSRLSPFSPIVLIGQNPVLTDDSMAEKVNLFKALAQQTGCGFIDVHAMFLALPGALENYYQDDVHPNSSGSQAWAVLVHSAFSAANSGPVGTAISRQSRGVILTLESFAQMKTAAAFNEMTAVKESVNYESRGQAMKLIGSGSGAPFYYLEIVDSRNIKTCRDRYVSVTVRLAVPSGSGTLTGRVALYDGITTVTSADGGPQGEAFYSQTLHIKVDPAATYVRLYIYLDQTSPADTITVDRICVADGAQPLDVKAIDELTALNYLSVLGGKSKGAMVVRNQNTGTTGVQVLDTAGSDDDDPITQFVVSLAAQGIAVKKRADLFARLLQAVDGSLYFGDGTVQPNIRLQSTGANLLRLLNAHFYCQDNKTWDLGIAGKAWRVGYISELRLGDSTVRVVAGIGSPEGGVTAPPGSLYLNEQGGAGQTYWVKEAGTGNTGWAAK